MAACIFGIFEAEMHKSGQTVWSDLVGLRFETDHDMIIVPIQMT